MEMTPGEPQSATDYDDRTTAAVKSVLVEIGQIDPDQVHTPSIFVDYLVITGAAT